MAVSRDEVELATERWNSRASPRNREGAARNSRPAWSEKRGMAKTFGTRNKLARDVASESYELENARVGNLQGVVLGITLQNA